MKKATKFLLGIVLGILLLTPVSQVKADWQQDNVGWWYSLNNGSYYKNTEAKINGKWYKFDDRGYMMTGWQLIWERNESRYVNGDIYKNWSYFDPVNGDKKLGWQNIDGKRYYFGLYGAYSGRISGLDGKDYYFDSDTCELKIGWFESGKYKYYADPNDGGALASSKTLIIDGISYTFDSGGTLINNIP